MFYVIFISALAAIAAGLCVMVYLKYRDDEYVQINWLELVIGSLICSFVVIPLITWIGFTIVRNNTVSYNEYYNGLETKAYSDTTTCHRDGSCTYTYNCDPYQVYHAAQTDSKGNVTVPAYYTTEYHDCPYATKEYDYYVDDTLGETYHIGGTRFASHPHEWRDGHGFDGVARGEPKQWVDARDRIKAGHPGGTTKHATYDNYIQANQDDIYDKHSDAIKSYLKHKQLPKVTTDIYDHYMADKAYFPTGLPVGTSKKDWEHRLLQLDGRIGKEKHADLSLVIVDSSKIPDSDRYTDALQAYWQSDALGKNTLSKNGIVVVVGTTGNTITWSRGFTGMPVGNEKLVVNLREDMMGKSAQPEYLIKSLEYLVFKSQPDGFKRVEMSDYKYLFAAIQPGGWAKFWIAFISFFVSLGIWFLMAIFDLRIPYGIRTYFNKENNS